MTTKQKRDVVKLKLRQLERKLTPIANQYWPLVEKRARLLSKLAAIK